MIGMRAFDGVTLAVFLTLVSAVSCGQEPDDPGDARRDSYRLTALRGAYSGDNPAQKFSGGLVSWRVGIRRRRR